MKKLRIYLRDRREKLIVVGLILVLLIIYFIPNIFQTVREGEAGVLYRRFFGGTVRDRVFGEGLHIIFPWDRMTIYNVRIQEARHEMEVLDDTGLQLKLSISIRYRPEYDLLGVLHQEVGPDYIKKIVVPEVESILRTTAASFDAVELYTTQYAILDRIVNESLTQALERFVMIDDVIIREIRLPESVRAAIEKKREEEQLAIAYEYILQRAEDEAKRMVIEAGGHRDANEAIQASLTADILKWKGIEATKSLSTSTNSKIIVIGNGPDGLPIILGADK